MVQAGNTGDHTEKLRESNAVEDEQTVNTVEERLANLNKITKDVDHSEADSEENLGGTTPEGEEKEADDGSQDDDQAGDDDGSDDATPGEDDSKEGQDDDKEMPPAFLRAAIHRGWKEEDAVEFFKDNPDAAIRTFQNCYMDVNNASKEWARIGKAKQEQQIRPSVKPEPKPVTVDLDKLQKDYDLDDAAMEGLRAQQEEIAALQTEQQPEPQPGQSDAVDPNKVLEIENFFGAETLSDYGEFYGALKLGQDWNDLSSGQRANRMRVLEQADLIILGAEAAQVKMDDIEALERAHMVVTEPIREQAIREGLKKTAVKRKKSMMLKPSEGTRSPKKVAASTGGKQGSRDREQLQADVQEKLNHLWPS
jgi:hypothetical protein